MSNVWCKKWLTMFDHLVYGIKFDCFDLSHMQNDIKRLLFFISQIYVVGLYFLKRGVGFEFGFGQQNM
jgi:hypothetical protein